MHRQTDRQTDNSCSVFRICWKIKIYCHLRGLCLNVYKKSVRQWGDFSCRLGQMVGGGGIWKGLWGSKLEGGRGEFGEMKSSNSLIQKNPDHTYIHTYIEICYVCSRLYIHIYKSENCETYMTEAKLNLLFNGWKGLPCFYGCLARLYQIKLYRNLLFIWPIISKEQSVYNWRFFVVKN